MSPASTTTSASATGTSPIPRSRCKSLKTCRRIDSLTDDRASGRSGADRASGRISEDAPVNLWLERAGRRLSALPGLTTVSAAPASTALLGLLVAVVSWNVTFLPPSFGLDNSWSSGLFMAAQRGMHFGTQIVFTYGPLAFLRQPAMWY